MQFRPRRSARLLENLAADQHAANLAGAGADFVELGIPQQSPGWVVVDVTVAPEALNGFKRHPGGALGCVENRAGGVLARGFAAIAGLRDRVDIGSRGI